MGEIKGISRQEEELQLKRVISIAEENLTKSKGEVVRLAAELHAMQEEFDESDKELQTIWHTLDDRFQDVNREVNRAEQARKKPYFGRIDFTDPKIGRPETYYIGRSVVAKDPAYPEVIDWRAPIAGVYYDSSLGNVTYSVKGEGKFTIDLSRKRTYEIENDVLKDFYDSDVVANDELLTKYLAKSKRAVLSEIIATIQQEQNEAIRKKPQHNMIVQGAAGSGKTTVAMHRISYILYNYELEFAPRDFYVIGSNQVLLNYITGVLPELNVYGVSQMTMEQLFVRLLYEDWNRKYKTHPVKKGVTSPEKGTMEWFRDLAGFCKKYEWNNIPRRDVVLEKTGVTLMTKREIENLLERFDHLSRADKIEKLTEHLMARFENEISGKYYSFSNSDRKRLTNQYEKYFGKREWKGSIFELYEQFLAAQRMKGISVDYLAEDFDVYDLAALAYIYKRIKETEIIREAGHVVIDEAQDFGMMVYGSLKYCLSKCTYTIMGDVAQNISYEYGLNDWTELRKLMLPGEFDYFGLLQKSYRNTVEIAEFATNILHHGSFQVYPVQPIVRHGEEVQTVGVKNFDELLKKTVSTIDGWQKNGLETIAVICSDEEETKRVRKALEGRIDLLPDIIDTMEFSTGVAVMTLEYTKGLEFDAVLIFDASKETYPSNDRYVKRLYVAATRALHALTVLYQGELTGLIADPVSEEQRAKAITEVVKPRKTMPEESEKTNEELERELALQGAKDMAEREKFGPRRIEVKKPAAEATISTLGRVKMSGVVPSIPTYMERRQMELGTKTKKVEAGEYGEAPENKDLQVPGHGKIDCSVRLIMKDKGKYDVISSYGILRIMPVAEDTVRICFAKGQQPNFPKSAKDLIQNGFSYKARETKDALELLTGKMLVRLEKKTGAVVVCDAKGKELVRERAKEPRQITEPKNYIFFAWDKKEQLLAKGPEGSKNMRIGMNAKYISFGDSNYEMPAIASDKGYEIYIPVGIKTYCCNIPMYGQYICEEQGNCIDYYIKVK